MAEQEQQEGQTAAYEAPGQEGPPPGTGPGYGNCSQCGGMLVLEWPVMWIVLTIIFIGCLLGLICLICVFTDRKWRCQNCGAIYPYAGG